MGKWAQRERKQERERERESVYTCTSVYNVLLTFFCQKCPALFSIVSSVPNIYSVTKSDNILGTLYTGIYWEHMNTFILYFYVDFTCQPGQYLDMETEECKPCGAGTYSLGGGERFEEWEQLPSGFKVSTETFQSFFQTDDQNTNCNM